MEGPASPSAFPTELPLEIQVRWEIWHSFVSLLRSYAAAASLGGQQHIVHSLSDSATVESQGRALRFFFHADKGDVMWHEQEASGTFHINQDGTFEFADGPKAMDVAAIDWIAQLGRIS